MGYGGSAGGSQWDRGGVPIGEVPRGMGWAGAPRGAGGIGEVGVHQGLHSPGGVSVLFGLTADGPWGRAGSRAQPTRGVTLVPSRACAEMDAQVPGVGAQSKGTVSLLFLWGFWYSQRCGCKYSVSPTGLGLAAGDGHKGARGNPGGLWRGLRSGGVRSGGRGREVSAHKPLTPNVFCATLVLSLG